MKEYSTKALVLAVEDSGELDKSIWLYTKKMGKVAARAKSARKITSKLSGHLQPLNFIRVRLVEKNGFQIVDALSVSRLKPSPEALAALFFIKEMTFELQQDKELWSLIKKTFQELKRKGTVSYRRLLENLGFSPKFAECNVCQSKNVSYFSQKEQVFLCRRCALPYQRRRSEEERKEFPDLIKI